jgi:hypothetical protein
VHTSFFDKKFFIGGCQEKITTLLSRFVIKAIFFVIIGSLLFLLIVGLLVSCAESFGQTLGQFAYTVQVKEEPTVREVKIWIDGDFGSADIIEIDNAIQAWNYALNGQIKLIVVDTYFHNEPEKVVEQIKSNGWLILKINSHMPIVTKEKDNRVGFADRLGGHHIYLVRDRLFNVDVFGITLHEIGHLLGCGHIGERLMNPTFSRFKFQCIDLETIKEVARYQKLDVNKMNWCIDKYN